MKLIHSKREKPNKHRSKEPMLDSFHDTTLRTRLDVGSAQSVGRVRSHMEDSALTLVFQTCTPDSQHTLGVFIVADGMGGHLNGELASSLAVQTVSGRLIQSVLEPLRLGQHTFSAEEMDTALTEALQAAQANVLGAVSGGGTTLTLGLVLDHTLHIAHVGDSRLYLAEGNGPLTARTLDHSLIRRLLDLGQISSEDVNNHPQRNVLFRALGQAEGFKADITSIPLTTPSLMLLCSDGLWGQVDEASIQRTLETQPDLQNAARRLVSQADEAGGVDNVSVILVKIQ